MDYRTTFDFFEIPDFETLIPKDKLVSEDKKELDLYESSSSDINFESSKKIIDIIYDSNDYNIQLNSNFDFKHLQELLKTIDLTKIQRYAFSMDVFESDIRYRHTFGNRFIDPFIKFGSFKAFETVINFILENYSINYVVYMLNYGFLLELKQRFIEPKNMFSTGKNDIKDYPLFDSFKLYFDYFVSIGLTNSIVFVKDLFIMFSNRYLMFSYDYDCKKIFSYILETVKSFKIFFSTIPLYELPVDIQYFKLAYCYGLNVHSDLIDKIVPSVFYRRQNILNSDILTFLYLAGRDAMNDLILLGLDSGALLFCLEEDKPSDFIYYLNQENYCKNFILKFEERIPLMDDYKGFKLEVNYSNPKAISSINVILDFARLNDKFPKRLRLTDYFLQKKYSNHSKEFISEVKDCLKYSMSDSLINLILSY